MQKNIYFDYHEQPCTNISPPLSVIDVALHFTEDLITNLSSSSSGPTLLLAKKRDNTGSSGRRVRVKKGRKYRFKVREDIF